MLRTFVLCNLWDLADGDVAECLDDIQTLGADGVSVVVTSGPVAQLRCREVRGPRVFRSQGGFFYRPTETRFAETTLKPLTSSWLKKSNPLEKVVTGCRERSLALRLRVSAFEVGRIAARHPHAAGQTVFGDVAPVALCPAQADVRALLRATLRDLAETYAPDGLELADLRYHSGVFGREGIEVAFDPSDGFLMLLETCFSEASRQRAHENGIDAGAAADAVRDTLQAALTSGHTEPVSAESVGAGSGAFAAYRKGQRDALHAALNDAIETAGMPVAVVLPSFADPLSPEGGAFAHRIHLADAIDALAWNEDDDARKNHVAEEAGPGGEGQASAYPAIEIDAGEILTAEPQALVRTVQQLADRGTPEVVLGNYGLWPPASTHAIKQAIRYAKRSTA